MSEYTTDDPKVFGEDMVFYLTFPVGGYHKTPSSLVSFRVYSDSPTDAQMSGKTGQVGTAITSWTQVADDPATFKLTYAAIADSNPSKASLYERYWYGVNFKWTHAADDTEVYQKRSFLLYRPQCVMVQMNVTYDDIVGRMSFLDEVGEGEEYVANMIANAREEIMNELTGTSDYDLIHFHDLQRANAALKYKTLMLIADDYETSSADSDKWAGISAKYQRRYENAISIAKVGVDTDKDGHWTPGETIDDTKAFNPIRLR